MHRGFTETGLSLYLYPWKALNAPDPVTLFSAEGRTSHTARLNTIQRALKIDRNALANGIAGSIPGTAGYLLLRM